MATLFPRNDDGCLVFSGKSDAFFRNLTASGNVLNLRF
jgi:hypothetical protein